MYTRTHTDCELFRDSGVFASRSKALGFQEAARETPAARGWKAEMQISCDSRASKASLCPCLPISLFAPLSRLLFLLRPSALFARLHGFVLPPFVPSCSPGTFFRAISSMFLSIEPEFALRLDALCHPFASYLVVGTALRYPCIAKALRHVAWMGSRAAFNVRRKELETGGGEGSVRNVGRGHERRRKEVASLLARASDRWRWPLSSPPPLGSAVIHHLGLFFTYFICNIFRNFYSVNRPSPCVATPGAGQLAKQSSRLVDHPQTEQRRERAGVKDDGRQESKGVSGSVSFVRTDCPRSPRGYASRTLYAKESRYGDPPELTPDRSV